MKKILLVIGILWMGCQSKERTDPAQDEDLIKNEITEFHRSLKKAYNGAKIDTDSLYDAYFEPGSYYAAPWGSSEPIDSTKRRMKNAVPRIKGYDNRLEIMKTKVFGNGGYIFFVLRQSYMIDGQQRDEYLPTTFVMERKDGAWVVAHAQRSTDYETMQQWFPAQNATQGASPEKK